MWQEAKANEKRIKELMVDHKRRAERRRAYYESRLGDPHQLLRVIGSSCKVYPDAEQFYYHENTDNLMPWQGDTDIKIDRFDGRSLLDFVPQATRQHVALSREEREMQDELNFERYHDLIEAERLHVTEKDRLEEVEEEWTKLLDRHQAKLAMLGGKQKGNKSNNKSFAFDYGTNKVQDDDEDYDNEKESQLLKEVDILQYVDDLTDKDKQVLNDMSGKYGIKSYARLLRVAKKDRDNELRTLYKKQEDGKPKEKLSRNHKRRRRERHQREEAQRYRRRHSPTYEPYYGKSSDSDSSDDNASTSDVVIEFGSGNTQDQRESSQQDKDEKEKQSVKSAPAKVEKKLTPMEKLKLKMRAGLEKQIVSDEHDRRKKEKEKEIENLQDLAKSQGLPITTYLRPEPPARQERYRSPPSRSPSPKHRSYRSPSPDRSRDRSRDRHSGSSRHKHRSSRRSPRRSRSPPRYRSPSVERREKRYKSSRDGKYRDKYSRH